MNITVPVRSFGLGAEGPSRAAPHPRGERMLPFHLSSRQGLVGADGDRSPREALGEGKHSTKPESRDSNLEPAPSF